MIRTCWSLRTRQDSWASAGIMGGERTSVSAETRDIFFEAAYFPADAILGRGAAPGSCDRCRPALRARRGSDRPGTRHRARGGVPDRLRRRDCRSCGGSRGGCGSCRPRAVTLRASRLARLLGVQLAPARVVAALEGLGMKVAANASGWSVTPPPFRFDIAIEADLIEEVARIAGFDAIPESAARLPQEFHALPEEHAAEVALSRGIAAPRLPGGDHAVLRGPGAAVRAVSGHTGTRAGQPDRKRSCGHARIAVAGVAEGCQREPAPPAGAHSPV